MTRLKIFIFFVFIGTFSTLVQAQESEVRENSLRVFLDCETRACDDDYFRTEIDFVNWVRDRTLADVHLIITSDTTGGGGKFYTFYFIGLEELDGLGDELTYTANTTDTEVEILQSLTQVIGVGLARFSTIKGDPHVFQISAGVSSAAPVDRIVSEDEVEDPWNFWVFELGTQFNLGGEEKEKSESYSLSFEARRTTETWKFEFEVDTSHNKNEHQLSDERTAVAEREQWGSELLLAYALADHWSLGIESDVGSDTRDNQDLFGGFFGEIQYSFFPYEEAPRRSFTALYGLGGRYFDWTEETIFGQTSETRAQHRIQFRYYQFQPWGSSTVSLNSTQYLHDTSLWNASLSGNLSFRVSRGVNLSIRGEYSLVEDQLFISRKGLTDEEILLGQFERPTDYEYSIRIGISYEFGSIFNNVVNNRFGESGGGGPSSGMMPSGMMPSGMPF
jgi:hypothetical protein